MKNSQTSPVSAPLPSLGLLALSVTLITYAVGQSGPIKPPPTSLGTVLLLGGILQIYSSLCARQAGQHSATTIALLPLGLFWLSLVGLEIFPALGFGELPNPAAMVAYLSMWGFYASLLFLNSFRQNHALQTLFGGLMICLLLLALGNLRQNPVFLISGGISGLVAGLAAGYTALAQLCNQGVGRTVLPLGQWQSSLEEEEEQFAP